MNDLFKLKNAVSIRRCKQVLAIWMEKPVTNYKAIPSSFEARCVYKAPVTRKAKSLCYSIYEVLLSFVVSSLGGEGHGGKGGGEEHKQTINCTFEITSPCWSLTIKGALNSLVSINRSVENINKLQKLFFDIVSYLLHPCQTACGLFIRRGNNRTRTWEAPPCKVWSTETYLEEEENT